MYPLTEMSAMVMPPGKARRMSPRILISLHITQNHEEERSISKIYIFNISIQNKLKGANSKKQALREATDSTQNTASHTHPQQADPLLD
jgi:hypothetical protein